MTSEEIKDSVSMIDLCHRYGIQVTRKGFIHCPFHGKDRTPSLKIYPNNTWHCFACGKGGDIFSFVQRMENCSFKEAFELLGGTKKDKSFAKEWKEKSQNDRAKRADLEAEYRFWLKVEATLKRLIKESTPFSDEWEKLIQEEPIVVGEREYYFDLLYGKKKYEE